MSTKEVIHLCPPNGESVMPCCGRSPLERLGDRMTEERGLVTCRPTPQVAQKCTECNLPLATENDFRHEYTGGERPELCWREWNNDICVLKPVNWRERALALEAEREKALKIIAHWLDTTDVLVSLSRGTKAIYKLAELYGLFPAGLPKTQVAAEPPRVTIADFDKLSKKEQEVLGLIAINNDYGHPAVVLKRLLALGMIERFSDNCLVVPIPVHKLWCEWCSRIEDKKKKKKGKRR